MLYRFLACAVFLAACSSTTTTPSPSAGAGEPSEAPAEDETPTENPPGTTPEPATAYTQAEVQDLFSTRCVRCHAGTNTVLDLRDFASTTIGIAVAGGTAKCSGSKFQTRIVPGNRDASLLWHKVVGTHDCGDAMPPPGKGTKLTASELERLGLYIDGLAATE